MTTYKIDPAHSSAQFTVRHMMISNVRGAFGKVEGAIEYDAANPERSRIEAAIDVASINTNDEKRDAHLRSSDFLDAGKHPSISFKSRSIESAGSDEWKIAGDLTIHGVTKPVTLDVEGPTPEATDPFGNVRIGASARTKIKRSDFGMTWNAALEAGGVMVGDELKIELDISAIRSQPAAA